MFSLKIGSIGLFLHRYIVAIFLEKVSLCLYEREREREVVLILDKNIII